MAQPLKGLPDLAKKRGSVPRIHTGWLTAACDPSAGASNTLFWPLRVICVCGIHKFIQAHIYTQIKIK